VGATIWGISANLPASYIEPMNPVLGEFIESEAIIPALDKPAIAVLIPPIVPDHAATLP
jgi:hypothetical protein